MSTRASVHLMRALIVVLAACLTSCAAQQPRQPPTPNETSPSTKQTVEGQNTRLQGTGIGAVVGGIVGGVIGHFVPGVGAPIAAGIGALIGGLGGAAYAEHVVNQRQEFADASAYLADCTAALKAEVESSKKFNADLENRLATIQHDQAQLTSAIRDSQRERNRMKEELELQNTALKQAESEGAPSKDVAEHERNIRLLIAEKTRLEAHIERLNDFSDQDVSRPAN